MIQVIMREALLLYKGSPEDRDGLPLHQRARFKTSAVR